MNKIFDGLLRQCSPDGTDLIENTFEHLAFAAAQLNERPAKPSTGLHPLKR